MSKEKPPSDWGGHGMNALLGATGGAILGVFLVMFVVREMGYYSPRTIFFGAVLVCCALSVVAGDRFWDAFWKILGEIFK